MARVGWDRHASGDGALNEPLLSGTAWSHSMTDVLSYHGHSLEPAFEPLLTPAWMSDQQGGKARSGFKGTESNAKTRLCQRWQQGHCRFGDRCNFAHGHQELRRPPGGARSDASRLYGQLGTGIGALPGYQGGMAPNFGMGAFPELQRQQVPPAGPFPGQPDLLGLQSSLQNPAFVGLGSANDNEMWIRQGRPVPGPPGWTAYTTEQGEVYYHHAPTNSTTWERPLEWP